MWSHQKRFEKTVAKDPYFTLLERQVCYGVPAYRLRFQVPYSQPTLLRWFRTLRGVIYQDSIKDLKPLSGEIEMDETMFGGKGAGKRSWGATGKWIVFGIY